jgi:hypothetical protein
MRDAPFEVVDPFVGGGTPLEMQELVDISVPSNESDDTKSQYISALNLNDLEFEPPMSRLKPTRSASNSSLDNMGAEAESPPALPLRPRVSNEEEQKEEEEEEEAKGPEMQERAGASPFLAIPANGKAKGGGTNPMSMELDEHLEDQ